MKLLQELTQPEVIEVNLTEAFTTAVKQLDLLSRGGKINMKGNAKDFFNANPTLVVGAAALALNAYANYKASTRNTIKLFAKDAYEKKMITDVVKTLLKTKRFRLLKTNYAQEGQYWELVRFHTV